MSLVALETAVLSHGLPRPLNVETSTRLAQIVREEGGEPCTVGVIDGRITTSMTDDEIRRLGNDRAARKLSLRDLPVAVAARASGGTTVAATLHLAASRGIEVFATGGIGGVHRTAAGEPPHDVSADLPALARYPLCTVCAGAKAILDLPATVEALETSGVTIVGVRTECFPAFYSRESELPVDVSVDSPSEAAAIFRARRALGLPGGVLVVTPAPRAAAIPAGEVEPVVRAAVEEAQARGLRAAAITPFLLQRVAAALGERALRANAALLENNARLAAHIALALSDLSPSP